MAPTTKELRDINKDLGKVMATLSTLRVRIEAITDNWIPTSVTCVECLEQTSEWVCGFTSRAPYCISCAKRLHIDPAPGSVDPLQSLSSLR